MRNWSDIAVLAKTRNLDGGFVVKATTGLPFLLSVGNEVAFVPPVLDMPRRGIVQQIDLLDDDTALVYFDCIDNRNDASALVGSHCLVQLDDKQRETISQMPASWAGWVVLDDEFGELGSIHDVIENPGQVLLEVERSPHIAAKQLFGADRADLPSDFLLIPLVDEFILDVDPETQRVYTHIPAGLLSL